MLRHFEPARAPLRLCSAGACEAVTAMQSGRMSLWCAVTSTAEPIFCTVQGTVHGPLGARGEKETTHNRYLREFGREHLKGGCLAVVVQRLVHQLHEYSVDP